MSNTFRLTRVAAALAVSILGACSSLVPPPPSAPGLAAPAMPARFAAANDAPVGVPMRDADWDVLGDAALAALVRQGLHGNLSLQQAVERIERARALAGGRDAARGLTGGVQMGASASRLAAVDAGGGDTHPQRVFTQLAAGWEPDLFGRLATQAEAGWMLVQAQTDDAKAMRLSVATEIARTWYEYQGLREQERLTQSVIANRQEVVRLVAVRTRAGETARFDEARARAELAEVMAQLPRLQADAQGASHRLAVLLGVLPSAFAPPADAGGPAPQRAALRIPAPADWMQQRADLRAARARLQARALDVQAIEAEFLPRLEIRGMLGFVAGTLTGLGGAGSAAWWLAPTVSLPWFDRARIDARLSAARAHEREDLLAYHQVTLVAVGEVEDALGRLGAGQQRLNHLRARLAHAQDAHGLAQARYLAGESDLLELLDAQRVAHVAALALAQAHAEQQSHAVFLLKALGTTPQRAA